jgi:hypothetical protein
MKERSGAAGNAHVHCRNDVHEPDAVIAVYHDATTGVGGSGGQQG